MSVHPTSDARPTPTDEDGTGRQHPIRFGLRHAPVENGLGVRAVRATADELELTAPLHDGVRDGDGRVAPVLVAMLADSGIGFLVFAAARLAAGAPTVDLRIDHLGRAAAEATAVVAEYTLLHIDDGIGVGRADLRDDTGRPIAHAVATMAVTGAPDRPGGLAPSRGTADGTRRERPPFDPAVLAPGKLETDGADVLFTPGPSATNLNGTTHGAVLAGVARAAQASFLATRVPDARPLTDTVEFLRPVPLDARLRVRTEEVRSGRRFWSLRSDLLLPDGRIAVRAVGSGTRTG